MMHSYKKYVAFLLVNAEIGKRYPKKKNRSLEKGVFHCRSLLLLKNSWFVTLFLTKWIISHNSVQFR